MKVVLILLFAGRVSFIVGEQVNAPSTIFAESERSLTLTPEPLSKGELGEEEAKAQ